MEFKRVWQEKEGLYYYEGTDGKRYGEGYRDAGEFHGDFALVEDKYDKKYFIDRNFKEYGKYRYEDMVDFSEGFALVKKRGKWYFIRSELNEYGSFDEYGRASRGIGGLEEYSEGWDEQPTSFKNGFAIVNEGGCCRFVDKNFRYHGRYGDAYPFRDGIALVESRGKYYYIDEEFEPHGEGYDLADSSFSDGFAAVKIGDKWYFVDNKNFELHGEGYDARKYEDYYYRFSEGFAAVKKDGKWYYVDKNFELHGEGYDKAYKFENGVAEVEKGGRRYIINTSFERIKRRGKELEEADYLEGVEHDVSIMGIPTALFTDEFVEKLKQAVHKHFRDKIDQCKDINEATKLLKEMKEASRDLEQKQAMYGNEKTVSSSNRIKEVTAEEFMQKSLRGQLNELF